MLLELNTPSRPRTRLLGSIVVPAHNEAAVIRRCLDALFEGIDPEELEVIVVCNGCTDDTAEIARRSPYPVTVLELTVGAKAPALRLGDATATALPRLYLDADVRLNGTAVRSVLSTLRDGALAARPPIRYDASRSSWIVRGYYRARGRVPSLLGALWGAGVYGLSEAGRARFDTFPDVMADDMWIDRQFAREEITIVDCEPVTVHAPRTLRNLLAVLRRANRGKRTDPAFITAADRTQGRRTTLRTLGDLRRLAGGGPEAALDVSVYVTLAAITRLTLALSPVGRDPVWERDESSRGVA